jgi:hypothetical protein
MEAKKMTRLASRVSPERVFPFTANQRIPGYGKWRGCDNAGTAQKPRSGGLVPMLVNAMVACLAAPAMLLPAGPLHSQQRALDVQRSDADAKTRAAAKYLSLPLSFAVNRGQAGEGVDFVARGQGYSLSLAQGSAILALNEASTPSKTADQVRAAHGHAVVRMELDGAAGRLLATGTEKLPGTVNYFLGSDPSQWRSGVPTYASVRYTGVYPGIDLVYHGDQGKLEYDFLVAPHAKPGQIRLHFAGAGKLRVGSSGELLVPVPGSEISFRRPTIYQIIGGRRRRVSGSFTLLAGGDAGFRLGSYDHARPLVIDPTLVYSTYLGGSGFPGDQASGIAIDADGNAYVAGSTDSTDFPVVSGSYDATDPATSTEVVFVTKVNPTGTAEVYSTYVGGTWGDWTEGMTIDSGGNAYVTGYTWSKDFPATTGAYQTTNIGWSHSVTNAFLFKLSADGSSLVYSTYLGGTGTLSVYGDSGHAVAVDAQGDAYVTGAAYSGNFPVTTGAYQTTNNATQWGSNVFVTEFTPDGSGLVYSTYLGGSAADIIGDEGDAIAIDADGNTYVAGKSYSSNFPVTTGAFQTKNLGAANGNYNAFVAEFEAGGSTLAYSTLLGGAGIADHGDRALGLAIDSAGDAYVAGEAYSANFPVTKGAFQTTNYGAIYASSNAFVTKVNPTGTGLIYSTLIGGYGAFESSGDSANALALDGYGDAYIAGTTYSLNFPVTVNAYQTQRRTDDSEPFVTVFDAAGSGVIYSTYFAGSSGDYGTGLATDGQGNIYFTGTTYSNDFPVTQGAFQTTNKAATKDSAGTNAFISEISLGAAGAPTPTTLTLVSSENPALVGGNVSFTATVTAQTGNTAPTGNVVFTVDQTPVETVALNAAGQAVLSGSFNQPGTYTMQASYAGNSGFAASSASLSETVRESATPKPIFTPAAGAYGHILSVTLSDSMKGATLYYTLNGAAPTTASRRYSGAIEIGKNTEVKAIAVAAGHTPSAVATANYTIKLPPAPAPVFSPAGNTYKSAITVKIGDKATTGLAIYYTTNGAAPTTSSTVYSPAGIRVSKNETIKAIAIAKGYSASAVATAVYKIK